MAKIILTPTDDLDKVLLSNREPNTEFVLTTGVYKTKGNWYYPDWTHLASNCKLYGNNSTIILSDAAIKSVNNVVRPDRDLNVFWAGANTYIENVTFDGNESIFNNADPSKAWFVTSGLRTSGKSTILNVTIQNIRGTYNGVNTLTKEIESFGISVYGTDGGSTIINCTVQNCPENSYISAISAGHVGTNCSKTIVSNCKVNIGKTNWFGYGINCNVNISNCEITAGPRIAIYNDTDNVDNAYIENCKFSNVDKLVSIITPAGSNAYKRNIKIKDTNVSFNQGATRHLIEMWDQNNDTNKRQIGPILLQNVNVSQDVATKLYVATVGNDIRPITIVDCNLPYGIENLAGNMLSLFPK